MRAATAQVTLQRRADLLIGWMGIVLKERSGFNHHPIAAESALRGLRLDKRLLHWMQLPVITQAFQRGNRRLSNLRDGQTAGGPRLHAERTIMVRIGAP